MTSSQVVLTAAVVLFVLLVVLVMWAGDEKWTVD